MLQENTIKDSESDLIEEAIDTMLERVSHIDIEYLIREHIPEDVLQQEAEARQLGQYAVQVWLDEISFRDTKELIRKHIPRDILYQEAKWRGWAGPEEHW